MRNAIATVMALAASTLLAGNVTAARGVVSHRISGCDYFLVETAVGDYVLLEWFGGTDPDKGDMLAGDFQSYGMKTIHDLTSDSEVTVWVEDYQLDKEDALEKLTEKCE